MGHFICHHEGRFFTWSTIVDAPITFGVSREEYEEDFRIEKGLDAFVHELPARMERALAKGTSSMSHGSLEDLVGHNYAGFGGTRLTFEQIIQIYCVEQREPVEGEGVPIKFDD